MIENQHHPVDHDHPENPESLKDFIEQKKDEHDAAVLDP